MNWKFSLIFRFYIESISLLKDPTTVELFFLNAKSAVYNVSTVSLPSKVIHCLILCLCKQLQSDRHQTANISPCQKCCCFPGKERGCEQIFALWIRGFSEMFTIASNTMIFWLIVRFVKLGSKQKNLSDSKFVTGPSHYKLDFLITEAVLLRYTSLYRRKLHYNFHFMNTSIMFVFMWGEM